MEEYATVMAHVMAREHWEGAGNVLAYMAGTFRFSVPPANSIVFLPTAHCALASETAGPPAAAMAPVMERGLMVGPESVHAATGGVGRAVRSFTVPRGVTPTMVPASLQILAAATTVGQALTVRTPNARLARLQLSLAVSTATAPSLPLHLTIATATLVGVASAVTPQSAPRDASPAKAYAPARATASAWRGIPGTTVGKLCAIRHAAPLGGAARHLTIAAASRYSRASPARSRTHHVATRKRVAATVPLGADLVAATHRGSASPFPMAA